MIEIFSAAAISIAEPAGGERAEKQQSGRAFFKSWGYGATPL